MGRLMSLNESILKIYSVINGCMLINQHAKNVDNRIFCIVFTNSLTLYAKHDLSPNLIILQTI